MSIKKNKNQLIISILVGIAIFAVTYQFVIKQHEENLKQKAEIERLKSSIGVNYAANENTTIYVVAKKDIPKNHTITGDDVEMKDLGMKTNGLFTEIKTVIGATTTKEILSGHPVLKSSLDISNDTALSEPRPGFRAVAATVPVSRMAPFIDDNVYLDIYTANNTIQASNIRVIKVLNADSKASKQILFEIKEEDVGPFIFGMTEDKLIPVQRNKDDKTDYSFAYDPFKYSSYTISSEDYSAIDTESIKPINDNTETSYVYSADSARKRGNTVEVIQGNVKQTLDF